MNTLLILLLLLLISSQTYISYIIFLISMIDIILYIILLGNYYLAIIFLIIYIGSIAILFIYILMVLSIISERKSGYLIYILPIISLGILILGINIPNYLNNYNIINLSYNLFTDLLLPIGLILFLSMIFAIRSI